VAREHGHALVLCDSHANLREESDYVGLLTQRQVGGPLIAPAWGHDSHLKAEQEAGLPVVAFDRPAEGVSADTALVENREGTRDSFSCCGISLSSRGAAWRTSKPRSGRALSTPVVSPSGTKARKRRPPDPSR
jgi:hypothetical protein